MYIYVYIHDVLRLNRQILGMNFRSLKQTNFFLWKYARKWFFQNIFATKVVGLSNLAI